VSAFVKRSVASATNVSRLLWKLYSATADWQAGAQNAEQALRFLLARKLGLPVTAKLILGHAGLSHEWSLSHRSDLSVLEHVFLDLEYAVEMPPPEVIFDLGANFGAASVFFAQRWPQSRVYAVEPNPEMFRRLREAAQAYPRIICMNYAVADRDGMADFIVAQNHVASSLFRGDPAGRKVAVATRTLSSLMAEAGVDRVDLLKFDIEGAEAFLFPDRSALDGFDVLLGEVHKDLIGMSETDFLRPFVGYRIEKRFESKNEFVVLATREAV
jgi:FkbM family methyltransferase